MTKVLGLTEITVKSHLRNVFRKIGATNRTQAVAVVLREGVNPTAGEPPSVSLPSEREEHGWVHQVVRVDRGLDPAQQVDLLGIAVARQVVDLEAVDTVTTSLITCQSGTRRPSHPFACGLRDVEVDVVIAHVTERRRPSSAPAPTLTTAAEGRRMKSGIDRTSTETSCLIEPALVLLHLRQFLADTPEVAVLVEALGDHRIDDHAVLERGFEELYRRSRTGTTGLVEANSISTYHGYGASSGSTIPVM